jgi:hypothetical protein
VSFESTVLLPPSELPHCPKPLLVDGAEPVDELPHCPKVLFVDGSGPVDLGFHASASQSELELLCLLPFQPPSREVGEVNPRPRPLPRLGYQWLSSC